MNILLWQTVLISTLSAIVVATAYRAPNGNCSTLVNTIHVFACALWLGASAWEATFRGVALLTLLPRNQFGGVQAKLFHILFRFGDVNCLIAVATFFYQHPVATLKTDPSALCQAFVVLGALFGSAVNTFILMPKGNDIMFACHKIEKDVGVGQTIRYLDMKPLEGNKRYHSLRSTFFIYHSLTQLTAVLSCACVAYRIAFLAARMEAI